MQEDGKSQRRRIKHFERHPCKILRLRIQRNGNPGFTSAQLLATIKQHVTSTLDDLGQECVPETYFHRIIFMAMMDDVDVTDMPQKNDDLRIQQTQKVRDWTARFQPSCRIFVGSRSENDLELRQVGDQRSEREMVGKRASQILLLLQKKNKQTRIRTHRRSWHHDSRARNLQTEKGKRKHLLQREPQDRQHDLQADRVGETPQHPHPRHEVR